MKKFNITFYNEHLHESFTVYKTVVLSKMIGITESGEYCEKLEDIKRNFHYGNFHEDVRNIKVISSYIDPGIPKNFRTSEHENACYGKLQELFADIMSGWARENCCSGDYESEKEENLKLMREVIVPGTEEVKNFLNFYCYVYNLPEIVIFTAEVE